MASDFTIAYLTTAPMDPVDTLPLAQKVGYSAIGVRLAPLTPEDTSRH